jgi:antitoxin (DNA-binding transcriptional repressor) of toxin-antitoxin stability system
MKTVTAAYARAHLPELLDFVSRGGRVTIERHRKPIAEIGPSPAAEKPVPKFGTLKGKAQILDPQAFAPLSEEELKEWYS